MLKDKSVASMAKLSAYLCKEVLSNEFKAHIWTRLLMHESEKEGLDGATLDLAQVQLVPRQCAYTLKLSYTSRPTNWVVVYYA